MKKNEKRFLIVGEMDGLGHVVEFHTDMNKAISRADLYFDLAYNPGTQDFDRLDKEFVELITYRIEDHEIFAKVSVWGRTNGFQVVEIVEIGADFQLNEFLVERMNLKTKNQNHRLEILDKIEKEFDIDLLKSWSE